MNHVVFNVDDQYRLKKNASVLIAYEGKCGDKWWYYQKFFASLAEYKKFGCQKDRLSLLDTTSKNL